LQVNVNKVWLTVSSVLLGLSFIFGNSIRTVFESVVFLFVVHPFDVGDALLITDPANSGDGPQYSKVHGSRVALFR
jgi:small-conductance mechanosensitive channel